MEPDPPRLPPPLATPRTPMLELLAENLREEHAPAAPSDYARYRLDLALRLATHLRNADAFGDALEEDELSEIGELLGTRPATLAEGDAALARLIGAEAAEVDARLAAYLYRRAVREEALWRGALGAGERAVFQKLT